MRFGGLETPSHSMQGPNGQFVGLRGMHGSHITVMTRSHIQAKPQPTLHSLTSVNHSVKLGGIARLHSLYLLIHRNTIMLTIIQILRWTGGPPSSWYSVNATKISSWKCTVLVQRPEQCDCSTEDIHRARKSNPEHQSPPFASPCPIHNHVLTRYRRLGPLLSSPPAASLQLRRVLSFCPPPP